MHRRVAGHFEAGTSSPSRHHANDADDHLLSKLQAQPPAGSCHHVHARAGHVVEPTCNYLRLVLELLSKACDAVNVNYVSLVLKLSGFEASPTKLRGDALRYERLPTLQKLLQLEQLKIREQLHDA